MKKYTDIVDGTRYYLNDFLSRVQIGALEVNKTQAETVPDFLNSNRTGQCAIAIQHGFARIGAHYKPGKDELKLRYSIVGNNKVNFLLENVTRNDTFPKNENEQIDFEIRRIFGGGARFFLQIIAISGFHPRVDEASSIVFKTENMELVSEEEKIHNLKIFSKEFKNPYALAVSAGSGFIKSINFDQAIEWGKNEIIK